MKDMDELALEEPMNSKMNDSSPGWFHSSSYERGFYTSATIGIFLCSVGIFFNLLVLFLILTSRKLRDNYLYVQIVSITLADLCFVIMVDAFTVYYDLQPWHLGPGFCKTWLLLDVALPSVSLLGLLLLNVDRVIFTYKHRLYNYLIQRTLSHVIVILSPWLISGSVVCFLWLGFSAVEPHPGFCIYGITNEANAASSWLTVFIPSLIIFVLLIFVFIAVIGEIPASVQMTTLQENLPFRDSRLEPAMSNVQSERRIISALLAVDFISLAITLPFSAYSLVSPVCTDMQSCESLQSLFQTLSWMRSSVTCVRPILFFLLTDIYHFCKLRFAQWYLGRSFVSEMSTITTDQNDQESRNICTGTGNDMMMMMMAQVSTRNLYSRNNSTTTTSVLTPPPSPFSVKETVSCGKGVKADVTANCQFTSKKEDGIFV